MLWRLIDFEDQLYELYNEWNSRTLINSEVEMKELAVVVCQPTSQGDHPSGSGGDCGVRIPIEGSRCQYKNCSKTNCSVPWHKPLCGLDRQDLLEKLKTMIFVVSAAELVFGFVPGYAVLLAPREYDKLYGTTESMFISSSTFGGLFILAASGVMLNIATTFSMKRLTWTYIVIANTLCIYILILSAIKIHFALLVSQKGVRGGFANATFAGKKKKELVSTGCACGILMLIGSVLHFMGNGTVYVYYNLKYIQPTMYNKKP